ncbi:MAG: hypothetical protein J1E77_08570 [Prevotella sp.]|nr:hypothetical protein [Prevotella sp.]
MATTVNSKTIAGQQQLLVTLDGSVDVSNVKRAIKMLRGVISISSPKAPKPIQRASLYNPETGERLNSKTMKVIENARQGKDIAFTGTADEFKEWAKSL